MATFNGSYAGGLVKCANIEGMSVGGSTDATVFVPMFTESDWLKIIRRDYGRYGIHYVGALPTGTNWIMGNFEAHTVNELKKYKIAASGAKSELLGHLGVTAVNVLAMDLYPALERKTVDAIVYPSYCLNTYKFHEVVKYAIITEIQKPQITNIIANLKAYNELPKAYQEALNEACLEITLSQLKGTEEIDDVGWDTAKKHGIKVITFEGEEKKIIRQAIIKMWEKYAAMTEDNAQLIKILRKYAGY
jgi:TRAP-type C4-dicarboxylate transport system substrate-binding protein